MYFHAVTPDSGLSCEDTKGFFRAGLDQGCFHVHLKLSVPCHQLQLHVIQLQCLLSLICRLHGGLVEPWKMMCRPMLGVTDLNGDGPLQMLV